MTFDQNVTAPSQALEQEAYPDFFKQRNWDVPAFSVNHLSTRRNKYSLVIPVINEGERIRNQLQATHDLGLSSKVDTIIADGGSTDGSLEPAFLESVNVRSVITKTGPGKLSAQLRCGYAVSLIDGYDGIITIDGNGKDSVESIADFITALEGGVDYAQASRFVPGGRSENTPLSRLLAIRLLHAPMLSLAARRWFSDTTQGFRAYSARYLLDERVQPFRDIFVKYELLAYLTVRASQLGLRTSEVPTARLYPAHEKIPTKISGAGAHMDLVSVLFSTLKGDYHPPHNAQS
ncbi:glycosyltransferase family 2 protein [Parvularcula sp. IMCC14364]|uniref:glycosyltransferase family 2 protein n=1 Tax=Parvularcula sp. IMCC14364 TaxID=3067902 RepID=UPI002741E9E7|nr:glycosyltransferase family 2 protein [Parvularcula sp. IMCC14364]